MGSSCRSLWSRRSCAAIGMFDVIMVSGIGEDAISAVSLVDFINQLISSVLTALSTGGYCVFLVRAEESGRGKGGCAASGADRGALAGTALMAVALAGNLLILGCSTALWKRA